ncbi:DOPA 4,5-dioxygenase [Balamuthia mandrillaris]
MQQHQPKQSSKAAAPDLQAEQNTFPAPVRSYDVHVYFFANNAKSTEAALKLREEALQAFPHVRIFEPRMQPVGPHPVAMWEADLSNPLDFGTFVPWMATRHGKLSVLVHPNTDDMVKDHTESALWLGERLPLIIDVLKQIIKRRKAQGPQPLLIPVLAKSPWGDQKGEKMSVMMSSTSEKG